MACHPKDDIFAAGYSDGTVLMVRIEDGAEILVRRTQAGTEDMITALTWDETGRRLAFGSSEGNAGLLDMPG